MKSKRNDFHALRKSRQTVVLDGPGSLSSSEKSGCSDSDVGTLPGRSVSVRGKRTLNAVFFGDALTPRVAARLCYTLRSRIRHEAAGSIAKELEELLPPTPFTRHGNTLALGNLRKASNKKKESPIQFYARGTIHDNKTEIFSVVGR